MLDHEAPAVRHLALTARGFLPGWDFVTILPTHEPLADNPGEQERAPYGPLHNPNHK